MHEKTGGGGRVGQKAYTHQPGGMNKASPGSISTYSPRDDLTSVRRVEAMRSRASNAGKVGAGGANSSCKAGGNRWTALCPCNWHSNTFGRS